MQHQSLLSGHLASDPPPTVPVHRRATDPVEPAAGGRRLRQQLVTAGVVAIVVGGLALGFAPAWGLVVGFAVAVPIEKVWSRHRYRVLRPGWRTDVLHFLFTHTLEVACLVAAAALCWIPLHLITIGPVAGWLATAPRLLVAGLGFLLFEVAYYAEHRLAHRWGFLWRFHAVHHSSADLDWLAASRLHPFEAFIGGFVIAPVFIVLGYPLAALGAFSTVTSIWAILIHANVDWRLRWLDRVYPTPEYHHWHHCADRGARDKNFGHPLLDTLFGTYYMPSGRRPERYGIDAAMPDGWFAQLAHPFRRHG